MREVGLPVAGMTLFLASIVVFGCGTSDHGGALDSQSDPGTADVEVPPPEFVERIIERRIDSSRQGIATGSFATPAISWPDIQADPRYRHVLAFRTSPMMPPSLSSVPSFGPIVLYSDTFDAMVVGPMEHPFDALVWVEGSAVKSGIPGEVDEVPAGWSQRWLVIEGKGIAATIDAWGARLLADRGRKPVDRYADAGLSYLGYWTDNGAFYYYATQAGMNQAQTMLAVRDDAMTRGIPYGYLQLDSWWYRKAEGTGLNPWGGVIEWAPLPEMFPDGMAAFQKALGWPLVLHNRWFAKDSIYRGTGQWVEGEQMALPIGGAVYEELAASAKSWGAVTYEQDWLVAQWEGLPWIRQATGRSESWWRSVHDAAVSKGLTVQACMASSAHLLAAVDLPGVTSIRTSIDYQKDLSKESFWPQFHTVNMLARALGAWPFKDNFQSSESRGEAEALISILSAGMVGASDEVGLADSALLLKTCRRDGLLLKPDRPAVPIDAMFLPHTRPYTVVAKSTRYGLGVWTYLAAFHLASEHPDRSDSDRLFALVSYDGVPVEGMFHYPSAVTDWGVNLEDDLGVVGQVVAWDMRLDQAVVVEGRLELPVAPGNADHAYVVLAPVLSNGIALLGEKDKFVTMADRRFSALKLEGDVILAELAGAPGEIVTLAAFDVRAGTRMADIAVAIGSDGTSKVRIGR